MFSNFSESEQDLQLMGQGRHCDTGQREAVFSFPVGLWMTRNGSESAAHNINGSHETTDNGFGKRGTPS